MANIPHQQAKLGGTVLSATAATAGPDSLAPDDRLVLVVQNNDAAAVTVTVTVPGTTRWGQDEPDVTSVSIPAGEMAAVGPFPRALADPSDNLVDVTASSASVNFYAVRA
ncbi:hypothetical protein B1813_19000 [Saccharomonospora piscinae]|uniref:Uncharacterized protein n=1 Tax=Saccharomonospora piscinae TaxID=687388 RepID=A0A1V8ZYD0_SACPI|nr:hypothetical protein [Saccharomonospora piscinae]OQO89929.1 hypothetical protein B1813_19000 [Saccharomonospora piscinae]